MIDRDEIIGIVTLSFVILIIVGIAFAGYIVNKEDKYCTSMGVSDKNIVENNWENNTTLVKLFAKCCDRGIASKENTVWCFG